MTSRERFFRTLDGLPVDRPPLWGEGIRDDVRAAWAVEGIPADRDLDAAFSVDRWDAVHPDIMADRFDISGTAPKEGSDRPADDPRRYPDDWTERVRRYRDRDYPVGIRVFRGLFLTLGVEDWRTLKPVLLRVADEPDMAARLMEAAAEFAIAVFDRAFAEVDFDFVLMSEPIASNAGPVAGPHTFRRICGPAYRRIVAHVRERGIRHLVFQSYGKAEAIAAEAFRTGCTAFWAGDVEPARIDFAGLRRAHGEVGLIGGIDLRVLDLPACEIEPVLRELVEPLMREGRYLPLLDGRVRAHVSYARYAAYRSALVRVVAELSGFGEDRAARSGGRR